MIIVAIAGVLTVCWLLLRLTTLALPVFAAVSTFMFGLQTGAGPVGAMLIGFAAGALTLAAGQALFAPSNSPVLRVVVGIVFAAPAAVASFSAITGLARLSGSGETWQLIFSVIGAAIIGGVAWMRLQAAHPIEPDEISLGRSPKTMRLGSRQEGSG